MREEEILDYPIQDEVIPLYKNIGTWERIASMIMDYTVTTALVFTFWVIFTLIKETDTVQIAVLIIVSPFYLYKDCINGMSPAKRFFGLQVIDLKTGKAAKPLQTVIRNFTFILLPLEILFGILKPKRRIGDFIANTKLIAVEHGNAKSILTDIKEQGFSFELIIAYLVSVSWIVGLFFLIEFLPSVLLKSF